MSMSDTATRPAAPSLARPAADDTRPDTRPTAWPAGPLRGVLARPLADYYLVLAATAALVALGVFMVLSASSVYSMVTTGNPYRLGLTQLAVALVGVPLAFGCSRLSRRWFIVVAWLGMALAIILLALVVVPGGPGRSVGGNQAWLSLGPLPAIQPSEFAKVALIVWSAALFSQPQRAGRLDEPRPLLVPYLPVAGLLLALVVAEKDLGTAVILGAIVVAQLWFVGAPGQIVGGLVGLAAAGSTLMIVFDATRRAKVLSFLNNFLPFLHLPAGSASDQPQNAIYALAIGGWWGTGPGASRLKWGGLYNGAHTDYILAVLGEELGLFGVLIVLGLLFTLVYTGLRIARRSSLLFWRVAACGVTGWFMVQATINTLVAFGLMPVMGVPFPLFSYGGSSLLACLIGVGVLLAAARHEPAALAAAAARQAEKQAKRLTGVVVAQRRAAG